jgi:gluconolactonase
VSILFRSRIFAGAGMALVLGAWSSSGPASADSAGARRTIGRVERADPRLDGILAPDARIEVLAEGFRWSEGPVWDRAHERLLFSDVPNNVVHAWSERDGVSVYLRPSGYTGPEGGGGREPGSNGLAFDAQGRLVMCQHGDRRVARLDEPPTAAGRAARFTPLVERFEGKRFNSPNDLVFGRDGALYFTDPPYGLPGTFDDPGRELGWNGVYRIAPDGRVSVLIKDLRAPNGIALSPDGRTLYVGLSDPDLPVVMAYDLAPEGTVGRGRVLFDTRPLRAIGPGAPDGMKIDAQGNVFTTGPGGVLVLTAKGEHLGAIVTGVQTANCAFGGPDGATLYITANDKLCRIRTRTKGLGF